MKRWKNLFLYLRQKHEFSLAQLPVLCYYGFMGYYRIIFRTDVNQREKGGGGGNTVTI